MSNPNKHSVEL